MKRTTTMFSTTLGIAILLIAAIAVPMDLGQTADAVKAKGVSNPQYGEATKNKVCGDMLCSEVSSEDRKNTSTTQTKSSDSSTESAGNAPSSTYDINALMDRMDSVHEKHQSQMVNMWQTMSPQEQAKMAQKMENMIEKMESKDMVKHMMEMDKEMHGDKKGDSKYTGDKMHGDKRQGTSTSDRPMKNKTPLYNETLNPRQIDYPNVLGFNDLHIHANRHLDPERSLGPAEHLLQTVVHHHCKVYDDMTAACLLYPYGMTDQDKPYGIEYVIITDQFNELPEEEQEYWHYHKTEFPRAEAVFPELTDEELEPILPILDETYGKVYYFWNYGDTYPMGEPYILNVHELPDH
ncbi:DUF1264 domain-containing protein [Nitrosopumilus sp.]|uniref:DUF1264 domain-containing protein n=1 Tax=Nitrosopumilus sp. TaxID=2024843 RepID=UPI00292D3BB4|nr:DUF1264 domain-containing protein [Nitrosopumilus sp.]